MFSNLCPHLPHLTSILISCLQRLLKDSNRKILDQDSSSCLARHLLQTLTPNNQSFITIIKACSSCQIFYYVWPDLKLLECNVYRLAISQFVGMLLTLLNKTTRSSVIQKTVRHLQPTSLQSSLMWAGEIRIKPI